MTIEIRTCDLFGPSDDDGVAYFDIDDPESPESGRSYGIGYRLIGDDPKDKRNWTYVRSICVTGVNEQDSNADIEKIAVEEIDDILSRHGTTRDELLQQYIGKARWGFTQYGGKD